MRPELPAMLYRPGSAFEWDGDGVDFLVVENDGDLDAALKAGWSAGKPSKSAAKPDPLDHDGDGHKGGSEPGEASTAAKGAKHKKAK